MNIDKIIKLTSTFLKENGGKILAGLGIAGLATTTILTVKATADVVSADPKTMNDEQKRKFLTKKIFPPVVAFVATSGAIIGGELLNEQRIKKLSATAAAIGSAYAGYIATSKNKFGGNAQADIDVENAVKDISWKCSEDEETFLFAGTTKPFVSNYTTMLECDNYLKELLMSNEQWTLKDAYESIGYDELIDSASENIGIKADTLLEDGYMPITSFKFSERMAGDVKVIYVEILTIKPGFDEQTGLPGDPKTFPFCPVQLEFLA